MKDNLAYKTDLETGRDNFCRLGAQVTPPTNIIYNEECEETMKRLPDKSIQLIIADPPYYKIKGEFDWKWKTFEEYLNWMESLAVEFKRILADNGSLFVYSHAKRVAYLQVRYDKYFTLENNIVWKTDDPFGTVYSKELRSFAPLTERVLFYSKDYDATGNEIIFEKFLKPQNPFSKYLLEEFERAAVSRLEIAKLFPSRTGGLTGCVSNWLNGDNVITEEQYLKIREYLGEGYLTKQYEELKQQYEELRRPFNNILNLSDVWEFNRESAASKAIQHDTVKPLRLSKAIVTTCSKENDLIYIPFVGSGTECVAVNELNRKFIGSEVNKKYCEIAEARIKGSRKNYDMFYDEAV